MSIFSFFRLAGWNRPPRRSHRRTPPRPRTVLQLDPLEERCLLDCTVIGGLVYDDANNNGLFDAGETPIANSVVELRNGGVETSIDRFGGDYRNFGLKPGESSEACKAACTDDNKCRAWTFARPGYVGKEAHCYLKKEIKPPRRKAGFISGVVR